MSKSLLRAILENPYDDDLRLVYSDWLEEQGDLTRAQFIRLQLEISRINPKDCNQSTCQSYGHGKCSHCRHVDSMRDLNGEMLSHGGGYFGWSPFGLELHKTHHQAIHYRRGFVEEVSLPLGVFQDEMMLLFSTCPVLKVNITDRLPAHPTVNLDDFTWRHSPDDPTALHADPGGNLLPMDVWESLSMKLHLARVLGKVYSSARDAQLDLSNTLVRAGRKLAGLPALEQK